MNDVPQIVEINEIIEETPTIKTFIFDWDVDKFGVPSPGEFGTSIMKNQCLFL